MTKYTFTPGCPPTFLPEDLDTSGMIDITIVSSAFRVFYDPQTQQTHDGEVYHKQAQEERLS